MCIYMLSNVYRTIIICCYEFETEMTYFLLRLEIMYVVSMKMDAKWQSCSN